MAIAFDNATTATLSGTGTDTFSHTTSGANRILWVGFETGTSGTPIISGVTYNGVAMTAHPDQTTSGIPTGSNTAQRVFMFYLVNPASGANNVVITWSTPPGNGEATASSYTGAAQTGQPDSHSTSNGTASSVSQNTTTVANNCWLVAVIRDNLNGATPPGAGTTARGTGVGAAFWDSNGPKSPAGTYHLDGSFGGSTTYGILEASIAPVSATANLGFFFAAAA